MKSKNNISRNNEGNEEKVEAQSSSENKKVEFLEEDEIV